MKTTAKDVRDIILELLTGVAKAQNNLSSQNGFAVWAACSIAFEALSDAFPPERLDVEDPDTRALIDVLRKATAASVVIDEKVPGGTMLC